MQSTEYVYVCSPDFRRYLDLSLRSLFFSGTLVESVVIYVVAERKVIWNYDDPRITVKVVKSIGSVGDWGSYWGTNKVHLCSSSADRVVFLDTDTIILGPIDQLWKGRNEDLLARLGVRTYTKYYNAEKWRAGLTSAGAGDYPLYSPGFMVFQNGSHRRLRDTWPKVIEQILSRSIPAIPPNRFAELYAFSIAASLEKLSHYAMEERGHRYAMLGESPDDAVVYHLGTPQFYRHYLPLEKKIGLDRQKNLPVPRPAFTEFHAQYTRTKHRLKTKFKENRDASLDY